MATTLPFGSGNSSKTPNTIPFGGSVPVVQKQPSLADSIWSGIASYGSAVKAASQAGVDQISQGFKDQANAQNPLDVIGAGAKVGMGAVGVASASLSPLVAPITKPIGDAVNAVADKVGSNPKVQQFANSPEGQAVSKGAETVGNLAGLAGTAAGFVEAPTIPSKVSSAAQSIKDAMVGTPAEQAALQAQRATEAAQQLQKSGVSDATPAYNPKLIREPSVNGVPRVQGGKGALGSRIVTPKASEIAAGEELSKLPGYDPKVTSLDKYNLVQSAITSKAKDLVASLQKENILRPPQEIIKVVSDAVEQVPEESLLIQKTDPIIGNYMRVVKNAVTQNDGTLGGELAVRKALDAAYANARGKLAFGSDKISALDDLHTAARNALNDDMIAHARSTDIKASLQSQSNLFRASDVLLNKAETEGNSSIDQLMKAHPTTTKVLKGAAKTAGLGAGLHLLP